MARLPDRFLDEVRERTTLSTLIQRTVPLKRAGREWKACCPFHTEFTPSFYVNDQKGFYHCFGCQAHGGAIDWLMQNHGMEFRDAVADLAAEAGMDIPAPDPQAAQREQEYDRLLGVNARAAEYFTQCLHADSDESKAARDTLNDRGIGQKSAAKFDIGFAPSAVGETSIAAALVQLAPADLRTLGLRREGQHGRDYDFFRSRIIIPIHDARGQVIGFGGRIIGEGDPKYLNSPDTPVFDKGKSLFNIHRASRHARAVNRLVIVEGYMDVIALDSVGIENTVAPNGTAITEQQLQTAWKLVDCPILFFDGDKAGRAASVRACRRALPIMEAGKTLRCAFPPDGQDPDDFARENGAGDVNILLDGAIPLVDVIWMEMQSRVDMTDPDAKAGIAAEIRNLLQTISNADVRNAYTEAFKIRYSSGGRQKSRRGARGGSVANAMLDAILLGLLEYPTVLAICADDVLGIRWKDEFHADLVDTLLAMPDRPTTAIEMQKTCEQRGWAAQLRQIRADLPLRVPFLGSQDPKTAQHALEQAIRAELRRK